VSDRHGPEPHGHAPHGPSLNPLLAETRFCPRCATPSPDKDGDRSLRCDACGLVAYFNPKPVACAIPRDEEGRIVLLRRGFEPGQGLWTFPGGFVDLGESVEDAARREVREELEIDVDLQGLVGVYSRPTDRVVLIVFAAMTRSGERPRTTAEATEVAAFAPEDLPWDALAFWSTERALRDAIAGDQPPAPASTRPSSSSR
jgi:ADP-ribose pyrophosphatase YjhB (NUDIX family)